MSGIEELFRNPHIREVLFKLLQSEPMNMRGFIEASRQGKPKANETRKKMEALGLITVKKLSGHGDAGVLDIRLTKHGRDVAEHEAAIDKLMKDRAKRKD